jgi:chromosome segregation ATPase
MSRWLTGLNFIGVLALAALCGVQWQANRKANLQAISLEQTRLAQAEKIAEQDRVITGYKADLDEFRARVTLSEQAIKKAEDQIAALAAQRNQLAAERDQLVAERAQLKTVLDSWIVAVAARDQALKHASEQIQKLATERDAAVLKFNDLATKYNAIVKELDVARAKQ